MHKPTNRPPVEDAYWFMNGVTTEEHKERLARWGAYFTIFAVIVVPLFVTFGVPMIADLFR